MTEREILDSWKEISVYLRRSIKTCQRWETEYDLPVHRLDGSPRASVFAYRTELDGWLQKMLHEREKTPPKNRKAALSVSRRYLYLIIGSLVLLMAVLIVWQIWRQGNTTPITPDIPSLAVLYFENNTGDENLEYLRSGLCEWLIADLNQSPHIRVLGSGRLLSILRNLDLVDADKYSSQDIAELAELAKIDYVLTGSFIQVGEKVVITGALQDPQTDVPTVSYKFECDGIGEISSCIDNITQRTKMALSITSSATAEYTEISAAEIFTDDAEAYRLYVEASRQQKIGDNIEALRLANEAVSIDEEFAQAYVNIARSYSQIRDQSKSIEYFNKALQFPHRMTHRQYLHIQGELKRKTGKYQEAIHIYNALIELYPHDWIAYNFLGAIYKQIEDFEKAKSCYETIVSFKIEYPFPYGNLGNVLNAMGFYSEAKSVHKDYVRKYPDNPWGYVDFAETSLSSGDFATAQRLVDHALEHNPNLYRAIRIKGDIYYCQNDIASAENTYHQLLNAKEPALRLNGFEGLKNLLLLQGRLDESQIFIKEAITLASERNFLDSLSDFWLAAAYVDLLLNQLDSALDKCDQAVESASAIDDLYRQRRARFYQALVLVAANRLDEAEAKIRELERLIKGRDNKQHIRYVYLVNSMIALARKNMPEGISYAEEAVNLLPHQHWREFWYIPFDHALFIITLANAHFLAGDLTRAEVEYIRITNLTTGRLYYGDIYAKAIYMLGRIYEKRGKMKKAREQYDKFIGLWKDADAANPELQEARTRAARLNKN